MRLTVYSTRHKDVVSGREKAVSHHHFIYRRLQNKGPCEVQMNSNAQIRISAICVQRYLRTETNVKFTYICHSAEHFNCGYF